jgi:tRNA pseudouridine55 synthase
MTGAPASPGERPAGPAVGLLVVDKPEGPTSHDVVALARRSLGVRQVGHTGTLDPMATGVLVLVVGRATRLAQFLSGREKQYLARLRLGIATDSWDRTGSVVSRTDPGARLPGSGEIEAALREFLGEHEQVPPPFSAKKVRGVPAYSLARRGRTVEIASARVTLHAAVIEGCEGPWVDVRLTCSAGFYVRALADSLGRRLGCGACLDALRRIASGSFTLQQSVPLERLEEPGGSAAAWLISVERALPDLPAVVLTGEGARRALHGNDVGPGDWTAAEVRPGPGAANGAWTRASAGFDAVQLLSPDGRLLAVARPGAAPGVLHPAVVLG